MACFFPVITLRRMGRSYSFLPSGYRFRASSPCWNVNGSSVALRGGGYGPRAWEQAGLARQVAYQLARLAGKGWKPRPNSDSDKRVSLHNSAFCYHFTSSRNPGGKVSQVRSIAAWCSIPVAWFGRKANLPDPISHRALSTVLLRPKFFGGQSHAGGLTPESSSIAPVSSWRWAVFWPAWLQLIARKKKLL